MPGRRLLPLLKAYGAGERGVVLDLGCGDSPYRDFFGAAAQYLRMDTVARDPEVITADATDLPLDDGSVDMILCFQMISDIPDLVGGLQELARVLRPGGKVLIYESMAYPQHDMPHDYWRVMPQGLRWAAGRAGFEVTSVDFLGGVFARLAVLVNEHLLWQVARARPLAPLAKAATAASNLVLGGLDSLRGSSHLAPDYLACLTKIAPTTD